MSQFHIETEVRDQGVVLHLKGDANCQETDSLRRALQPVLERKPKLVVLDLDELDFINSLGLGVLLEFRQNLMANGGRLNLARAHDQVEDVLKKTRLVELFPAYGSPDEALDAGSRHRG